MDNYTEHIIKKKTAPKQIMMVTLGYVLVVIGLAATIMLPFGIFLLIISGFILYMSYLNCNLEYEYLIVNGDTEISKIVAKKTRKKLFEFSLGDIIGIYQFNSKLLENELSHRENLICKDFTSGSVDNSSDCYVFLINYNSKNIMVTLELDEKSLNHYKMVAKSKIKK